MRVLRAKIIETKSGQEIALTSAKIEELYLDYFNNFMTIRGFAEYYGLRMFQATQIILRGREINHARGIK